MVVCPICKHEGNKIEIIDLNECSYEKHFICNKCGHIIESQTWRRELW
ncbi:hypothetical protein [Methanosarcina spherical virus]|nr:hypothetical protein [Methanosarcina spherical virus]WKN02297.1 hypothetical protein HCCKFEEG_00003 [Methanosarcina spherical virus]WKN02319.1 hypothetical protein OBGAJBEG_00003 [Methanosarcina spherical virus]WKN02339.1 hypothetical protein FJIADALF_00003 [Methanosarcina spherical virus]